MKAKVFNTILSFFIAFACQAQNNKIDCTSFKEGTFYYIKNDSTHEKVIIDRKRKYQTETYQTSGIAIKYKVKWINNCEYQLKQVWSSDKKIRKYPNGPSTILIMDLHENGYVSTCNCILGDNVNPWEVKVFRIK